MPETAIEKKNKHIPFHSIHFDLTSAMLLSFFKDQIQLLSFKIIKPQ